MGTYQIVSPPTGMSTHDTSFAPSQVEVARPRVGRESAPVTPPQTVYTGLKHVIDAVAALVLLVPAVPIIFIAAAVTRLTSPGPAFYRQTRLGRGGKPFKICKIRTMVANAEARTGAVWAQANDPRVTRLGRLLRRTHIDEFPQLFHVLSGRMSLVGPRPERPEFVHRLQWEIPRYAERLSVKPGVTGLAQLLLPPDAEVDDVSRKLRYDLYYISHLTFWLDLKVVGHTAWLLVTTVGAALTGPFRLPRGEAVNQWTAELENRDRSVAEAGLAR